MTQTTNTTQNKEELEQEAKLVHKILQECIASEVIYETKIAELHLIKGLNKAEELLSKLLSQAHQSGIEEGAEAERAKITKLLEDEYENMENNASFYLKLSEVINENTKASKG